MISVSTVPSAYHIRRTASRTSAKASAFLSHSARCSGVGSFRGVSVVSYAFDCPGGIGGSN